jgi:hypothetical protein
MTRVEVSCDRCGGTVEAGRSRLVVESGPLRTRRSGAGGEPAIDPCPGCSEALLGWLAESRIGPNARRPSDRN